MFRHNTLRGRSERYRPVQPGRHAASLAARPRARSWTIRRAGASGSPRSGPDAPEPSTPSLPWQSGRASNGLYQTKIPAELANDDPADGGGEPYRSAPSVTHSVPGQGRTGCPRQRPFVAVFPGRGPHPALSPRASRTAILRVAVTDDAGDGTPMSRSGLETGTPRFSVVLPGRSNPFICRYFRPRTIGAHPAPCQAPGRTEPKGTHDLPQTARRGAGY